MDLEIKMGTIIVLNNSRFGNGNPRLGEALMKSFLESLAETEELPQAILLYNAGAALVCQDSPVLEELKVLEEKGVEIAASLESLQFYNMTASMAVGTTISMDDMTRMLMDAPKVVKP